VLPLDALIYEYACFNFFFSEDVFEWKLVDKNKKGSRIDKIDNFQEKNSPIIRFRTSIEGPCVPERFANFLMDS